MGGEIAICITHLNRMFASDENDIRNTNSNNTIYIGSQSIQSGLKTRVLNEFKRHKFETQ